MTTPRCALAWGLFAVGACAPDKADLPLDTAPDSSALDADGDGAVSTEDCDDDDAQVHPGADERCNEADDDCDGAVDENPTDAPDWYVDGDGDGFGAALSDVLSCDRPGEAAAEGGDCDDAEAAVHPGAEELCDGLDNDCDGAIDDEAIDAVACVPDDDGDGYGQDVPPEQCCALGSGYVVPGEADCDDDNRTIHPGGIERCNAMDDDCDGGVDEDDDGDDTVDSLCDLYGEHVVSDADVMVYGDLLTGLRTSFLLSDANADGYADLWAGAQKAEVDGAAWSGLVYLLHGPFSASVLAADVTAAVIQGTPSSQTGYRIFDPGDLDGDGYPELWISAATDPSTAGGGSVRLMSGPFEGERSILDAAVSWVPDEDDWDLRDTDLGAGDYDADGETDLIIGASVAWGAEGRSAGMVWVTRQDSTTGERPLSDAPIRIEAESTQDQIGMAVAIIGSTTGDGGNDLVISAMCENTHANAGSVWVIDEPPADGVYVISDLADNQMLGEYFSAGAGQEVIDAGDMNDDGYTDYAVGAGGTSSEEAVTGAVYVVYGPTGSRTSFAEADVKLTGVEAQEMVRNVAGNADVDADGHLDLLVSGFNYGDGSLYGTSYLVFGPMPEGTTSLRRADATFRGEMYMHSAGSGLSMSGDTNRDGYPELVIGAYGYEDESFDAGVLYLFHGQPR